MNKLYVIGIGPGDEDGMTLQARSVLEECDVIIGYKTYTDIVRTIIGESKKYIATGMRQEKDRCVMAFEEARSGGGKVCLVCSGDACIYGMSSLVFEISSGYPDVSIKIIPGVTAALSGSALLGAPLGHDCAIISLSDLLTPMDVIMKRVKAAAEGDFVICLYNPGSLGRRDHLRKACETVLKYRDGSTVCGVASNIGRQGEEYRIMTLNELSSYRSDMVTTVFIGNSTTKRMGDKMVTPRGYRL